MTIFMVSFSFLTISNVFVSSLSPTVSNFWKSRVSYNNYIRLVGFSLFFLLIHYFFEFSLDHKRYVNLIVNDFNVIFTSIKVIFTILG